MLRHKEPRESLSNKGRVLRMYVVIMYCSMFDVCLGKNVELEFSYRVLVSGSYWNCEIDYGIDYCLSSLVFAGSKP